MTDPWPYPGTPSDDSPGEAPPPADPDHAQPATPPPLHPSTGAAVPPGYPPVFDPGAVPPVPARRNRALLIALAVGAVVVVLLALVLVPGLLRGNNAAKTGAAGSSASASPAPTPVSPETYQQMLDALDKTVAPLIQALPGATTPAALQTAVTNLELALRAEIQSLEGITPPPAVTQGHRDLVQGLGALLSQVSDFRLAERVCVGSAALGDLSQQAGPASSLRMAFQELATASPAYHVGTFLPAPVALQADRRLGNGTMIKKIGRSGLGKFTVENKGEDDVVITLAPVGSTAATFAVYVQGKANHTVSGIPDGTYNAYLSVGKDWDSGAKSFTHECQQEKFDDTFDFKTTGRTYKVWTLTLDADTGGNTSTSKVDPGGVPT